MECEDNRYLIHTLGERVKELTCLHRVAQILQDNQLSIADWLRALGNLLPPAWQYPEETAVRIRLGDTEFTGPGFRRTPWMQQAEFTDIEETKGSIEVVYLTEKPAAFEGPFLAEERSLINSLVEMIRSAVDRRKAENALKEREARITAILQAIPDLMFRLSADGVHLDFYASRLDELYLNPKEFLGKRVEEVLPRDIGAMYQDHIRKALETRETQVFEYRLDSPEGPKYYEGRMAACGEKETLTMVRNITDRKRAEAALRESEQRFQNAFEHAPIGMALVAPEGRWVKVNKSLCNLVGYPEDELLRKTFQDITHPDDLEVDLEFVRQMLAKEIQTYQMEKRYVHKSGRIVWIWLSVSLIWKDEDNPLYFISQIEDITDRKQAEENLKKSEERFSKFFMLAPIGITVSSLTDGRLMDVNREFETMLGFSRSEAVGRTTIELGVWLDLKDREDIMKRVSIEGKVKDLDLQIRDKGGNIVSQRFSAEPIEIDGRPCLLATFVDVTRQKRAEQELRQYHEHLEELVGARTAELSAANKKLQELDRLKSMFIASMSHELRTPLNSIIGFTGMTLQGLSGELNDEQKDNLTRVYFSAHHLLNLITDVIDISKIEAGRVEAYPGEFSLRAVVDDAVTTIATQLKEKGLKLEIDMPLDIRLYTDKRRLLQCLINYLSNAVKFTERGAITVAARVVNGQVELSVRDTGIGIAENDIPRLFEPFERLDTHLRVKTGGTGLGLYLTKKLATDVLQGGISVASSEGQGSTFTLHIPLDISKSPNVPAGNIL